MSSGKPAIVRPGEARPVRGGGLVLAIGAGGATGLAYAAGALWALEEGLGLDMRTAPQVIIGTSAGAVAGAYLRLGHTPADLVTMEPPELTSPDPRRRALLVRHEEPPLHAVRRLVGTGIELAHHARRRPRAAVPDERRTRRFPSGLFSVTDADLEHQGFTAAWPTDPLWLIASDLDSFERVVFRTPDPVAAAPGRPRTPNLRTAIMASMAFPGVWPPVLYEGRRLYDGGVLRSSTNMDLALEARPRAVIGIVPFGLDPRQSLDGRSIPFGRRGTVRQTFKEVALLASHGIATMTFAPTRAEIAMVGPRVFDRSRAAALAEAAHEATLRRLDLPEAGAFVDAARRAVRFGSSAA